MHGRKWISQDLVLAVFFLCNRSGLSAFTNITVQLRDGYSESSGRVVLTIDGETGTLCDFRGYDVIDATVICQSMNHSYGYPVGNNFFGAGEEKLLVDDLRCIENGNLTACNPITYGNCAPVSTAGVICSDDWTADVRLDIVEGSTAGRGRIELVIGENRTGICQSQGTQPWWTNVDADVVCRMMNYSSGVAMNNAYRWDPSVMPISDGFDCRGNENHLFDCRPQLGERRSLCSTPYAAGVLCIQNNTDFTMELIGGSSSIRGVVQFRTSSFNSTLYSGYMTGETANYVCKSLGFSSVGLGFHNTPFGSYQEEFEWLDYQRCDERSDDSFLQCKSAQLIKNTYGHGAAVACIDENVKDLVSLLHQSNYYESAGRVLVQLDNETKIYVCDRRFGENEAMAICRTLGYGYGALLGGCMADDDIDSDASFLWFLSCSPQSSSFQDCLSSGLGAKVLSTKCDVASVICHNGSYVPDIRVELINSTSRGSGALYVYYDDCQGLLVDSRWTDQDAHAVCRMMNYSTGIGTGWRSDVYFQWPVLLNGVDCGTDQSNIKDCSYGFAENSLVSNTVTVACFDNEEDIHNAALNLSLVGGNLPNYGLMAVTLAHHHGTVCDRTTQPYEPYADVSCRTLGYTYGKVIRFAKFHDIMRLHPILVSGMTCSGSEDSLSDCTIVYGGSYCNNMQNTGLFCTEKVFGTDACLQLVDGSSEKEGALEIVVDGVPIVLNSGMYSQIRPLVPWICGLLGFRNTSGTVSYTPNARGIVPGFSYMTCAGNAASVTQCLSDWILQGITYQSVIKLTCQERDANDPPSIITDRCDSGRHACPPLSNWVYENGVYSCKCQDGLIKTPDGQCVAPPNPRCSEFGYAFLFPYGAGQGDNSFTDVDDDCPVRIQFPFPLPVFEQQFMEIFICSNGIVSFGSSFFRYTPAPSVYLRPRTVLAPYYTDIDMRLASGGGTVYFQLHTASSGTSSYSSLSAAVEYYINNIEYLPGFTADIILIVTWHEVHPYRHFPSTEQSTFQLLLVSDGATTITMYIYGQCMMGWTQYKPILVGYSSPETVVQNMHSFEVTALELDKYTFTSGTKGLLYYRLTRADNEMVNYDALCLQWYSVNVPRTYYFGQALELMEECPCNTILSRLDYWYIPYNQTDDIICSTLRPALRFGHHGKICCYDRNTGAFLTSFTNAGGFQEFSPITHPADHVQFDTSMRRYCCHLSTQYLCDKYFALRPIGSCYNMYPSRISWSFGDPHFKTLDGKLYTFNGHGEYILLRIKHPNETFTLQSRMQPLGNGTAFTAFVAEDKTTSKIQIELNHNKSGMVIFVNNIDYTQNFYGDDHFEVITDHLDAIRHGLDIIALFKTSGVGMRVVLVPGLVLEITLNVPSVYQTFTEGLLGNFDKDPENDFIYPDGTRIPSNSSERNIFYFCKAWLVNDTSTIFNYPPGQGNSDFTNFNFVPFFLEDASTTDLATAEQICNMTNIPCIHDYLSTNDEYLAIHSLMVDQESDQIMHILQNEIPSISGSTCTVHLSVGEEVEIILSGRDDRNFSYFLTEDTTIPVSLNTLENGSARVILTSTSEIPVTLGVSVVDEDGVSAAPVYFRFIFCTGCNGHGSCNFNKTRIDSRTTPTFAYAHCDCYPFWQGSNCELDYDGCAATPCHPEQTCFDYNTTLHEQLQLAFWCSDCPNGTYENPDGKCLDIDECMDNLSNCQQQCENTEMSFMCSCEDGYRQNTTNSSQCDDIDECAEYLRLCNHICVNADGHYTCDCFDGFEINSKGDCDFVFDPCIGLDYNCTMASGCLMKEGKPHCVCSSGYILCSDNKTCIDVNECEEGACSQGCINSEGGFECYCYIGYQLDLRGGDCIKCSFPRYGDNCSEECICGHGSKECNHISGCVCEPGWSGVNCDHDLDECVQDPFLCDMMVQQCVNTPGSYMCQCKDGYEMRHDRVCIDIDECSSREMNNCSEYQVCENVPSAHVCNCADGFMMDPSNNNSCIDVNECDVGIAWCEQLCENKQGRYNCWCYPGYFLGQGRKRCIFDQDICTVGANMTCSHICLLDGQGNEICACPLGLRLDTDNITCTDVDECEEGIAKCSVKESCVNTYRGYNCSCPDGFKLENDRRTCTECDSFHYGYNCENICHCGFGSYMCDNVSGCLCTSGWFGETCGLDVDECVSNPCQGDSDLICQNSPGNFSCVCANGYSMNSGGICEECPDGTYGKNCVGVCDCVGDGVMSSLCNKTTGACSCLITWTGYNCTDDVDDCSNGVHDCDLNKSTCRNEIGSFHCECMDGYEMTNDTCIECIDGRYGRNCLGVCSCNTNRTTKSTTCNKTTGACPCLSTWIGYNCSDDVDECSSGGHHCSMIGAECVNDIGSFHCECRNGFVMSSNKTCVVDNSTDSVVDACAIHKTVEVACDEGSSCVVENGLPVCSSFQNSGKSNFQSENLLIVLSVCICLVTIACTSTTIVYCNIKKYKQGNINHLSRLGKLGNKVSGQISDAKSTNDCACTPTSGHGSIGGKQAALSVGVVAMDVDLEDLETR